MNGWRCHFVRRFLTVRGGMAMLVRGAMVQE
jgi:hypothetical protein